MSGQRICIDKMELRVLRDDLQEKAAKELNEDPKRHGEVFEYITEWLRKQPHLIVNLDQQTLAAFFRGCKWNLQLIKEKLDMYYTCRTAIPEFYGNRDPMSEDVQNVLNSGLICVLPKPKIDLGSRICVFLFSKADPYKTPVVAIVKVLFMILDILMREDDDYVISGISIFADYDGIPTNLLLQYTPPIVRKYIKCFQNAYPLRIKSFSCINAPVLLESIYNLSKHFIKNKVHKRVQILNSENSINFMNTYPRESLPIEYGGNNGSISDAVETWKKKLESYRDWFIEDQRCGTNEKLRLEKSKLFEEEFGVEGSFRKLVVD